MEKSKGSSKAKKSKAKKHVDVSPEPSPDIFTPLNILYLPINVRNWTCVPLPRLTKYY